VAHEGKCVEHAAAKRSRAILRFAAVKVAAASSRRIRQTHRLEAGATSNHRLRAARRSRMSPMKDLSNQAPENFFGIAG